MNHCTVAQLDMYGTPDQVVTQGLRDAVPAHVPHHTIAHHIGYLHTP